MTEKDADIIIETPSSAFSDLSDEVKADIEKTAEEWKQSKKGEKYTITEFLKTKYKDNPRAYEYFSCLKQVRKDGIMPIKKAPRKFSSPEAIAREELAVVLREYLKKYFKNNQQIDQDSKVFLLDDNYNLPPYFWVRMNSNVLPIMYKLGQDKEVMKLRTWQLAKGIMKTHEKELGDRLQKTDFSNMNHVIHTIIQFLEKYLLPTYNDLMKKARQQAVNNKKNEIKKSEQEQLDFEKKIKKRGGGIKEVKSVGFDTTELL